MTDLEKLKALLTEFGVGFEEDKENHLVRCDEGAEKVLGYAGFMTIFRFTAEGLFIDMGAWE